MHQHHDDEHPHDHDYRNLQAVDAPLDSANQSLADALRASFRILKAIMVVLIVLYLFSNVRSIAGHEQALVLRFGRLLPKIHEAGLIWAFPFPIDEIVPLPTRRSNEIRVESHTFQRRETEKGKPLSFISRPPHEGLHPGVDGALLTAESGLAHVQWKVTYKFKDLGNFVQQIRGDAVAAAEELIKTLVETIGIQLAGELTAEELIRTRVDHVQSEMRWRINERLEELKSGVDVTSVEMFEPTPPLQVRESFDATQRAENAKQQKIRGAEQEAAKILSNAAGAKYKEVLDLLNAIDRGASNEEKVKKEQAEKSLEALKAELDQLVRKEVEGEAGRLIKDASAYFSVVVNEMEADVRLYRTILPDYQRNPELLIARLWSQAKEEILQGHGVTKIFRPSGLKEFRLKIPLDPEQTRAEEKGRLEEKKFDASKLRKPIYHPVGPEYD